MAASNDLPVPDLTLICSTIGPLGRLSPLLSSVDVARDQLDIQLIVVNQSDEDVSAVLSERAEVITSPRGLSRGRNAALTLARGEIVAFPDDDVWYPDRLLSSVVAMLGGEPDLDGVLVRQAGTEDGGVNALRYPTSSQPVSRANVLLTGISSGVFLRRRVIVRVGAFSELLGVGAGTPWGAGEETDYLLRALDLGFRIRFEADRWVVHPVELIDDETARRKQRAYGRGIGHVLRGRSFSAMYPARLIARRMVKSALLCGRGRLADARTAASFAVGLAEGFASRQPPTVEDHPICSASRSRTR